jgi:ATP-binding cassette subfamily B protein
VTDPFALDRGRPSAGELAGNARYAMRTGLAAAPLLVSVRALLTLVAGLLPIVAAWLLKALLDEFTQPRPGGHRTMLIALMAVSAMVTALVSPVQQRLDAELRFRLETRFQRTLYEAVNRMRGLATLENPNFQDRLRLAQEAAASSSQVVANLLGLAQVTVTTVAFVGSVAALSPWLVAIVVALMVPAAYLQFRLTGRRAGIVAAVEHSDRRRNFYEGLLNRTDAAKEIRLFGLGDFFLGRMLAELGTVQRGHRTVASRQFRLDAGFAVLNGCLAALGLVWVVRLATADALTAGDIALFVASFAGLQAGLAGIVDETSSLLYYVMVIGHYRVVVAAPPDLPAGLGTAEVGPLERIDVVNVWFRYADNQDWVLRGLSLTLRRDAFTGVVGLNGAGKSTLIKLLCRFYDPARGVVRWNGVDIRELDIGQLRARISTVFQDFMDYDLSAAENIGIGDVTRLGDRPAIERAASMAGAADPIAALPHGYDTLLTRSFFSNAEAAEATHGVVLSGGQWQRVALARSLMRYDCDLLILDEPSAGLDAAAEEEVLAFLRSWRRGRASLLISHRLGTLRDADEIVVISDGRVAESGTHDQLMACATSTYRRLFLLQGHGYRSGEHRPAASRR